LKENSFNSDIPDIELIREYVKGDELILLQELYSRYMHLVYGVCIKYLKNRDDAKNATIEIFEKLQDLLKRTIVVNFKDWLHVVTRNYCLMLLRKKSTKSKRQIEVAFEAQKFEDKKEEIHPIDNELNGKMPTALNECIEKLENKQKECIKLFYNKNNCYRTIAVQLGIDEKEVKNHIQDGKRNLKNCLEQEHEIRKSI